MYMSVLYTNLGHEKYLIMLPRVHAFDTYSSRATGHLPVPGCRKLGGSQACGRVTRI